MSPTLIVGLVIAAYAAFGLLGFVITRVLRHGGLKEVAEEDPVTAGMLMTYGAGLRGAVWVSSVTCYAFAALFALTGFSDAVWVFAAALIMDIGLFLTWPMRSAYVAHLSPLQRAGEVATVLTLASCLATLLALRQSGALA